MYCSGYLSFCSVTFPLPLPSWFRKLPNVDLGECQTHNVSIWLRFLSLITLDVLTKRCLSFLARDENFRANFTQYGLGSYFVDVLVADAGRLGLREVPLFDAIITDRK